MIKMSDTALSDITGGGGGILLGIGLGIGILVTLAAGILDGITRPLKCNN